MRAPSPDYFFNILRDSLEDLIARRWRGLAYELLIPCPTILDGRTPCDGRFRFRNLQRFRELGELTIVCHECVQRHDVSRLLTGFSLPRVFPSWEFAKLSERLESVVVGIHQLEEHSADIANEMRAVLKVVSNEVPDCPSLFTLAEKATGRWARVRIRKYYRLVLWCEHPGGWHPWPEASYDIGQPRMWLTSIFHEAMWCERLGLVCLRLQD